MADSIITIEEPITVDSRMIDSSTVDIFIAHFILINSIIIIVETATVYSNALGSTTVDSTILDPILVYMQVYYWHLPFYQHLPQWNTHSRTHVDQQPWIRLLTVVYPRHFTSCSRFNRVCAEVGVLGDLLGTANLRPRHSPATLGIRCLPSEQ